MTYFEKIISLTRPYWPRVMGSIALSLMASGLTAAIAWVVKPAIDHVVVDGNYALMKFIPLVIIVLFTVKGLIHFGQMYLMHSAGLKMVREMRNTLYNHLLHLPVGYFNKESSGVVISRIINDVEILKGLISTVLKTFVMEIPTVIFLMGVAFYRRWDLALITLLLIPFIALSTKKFGKGVKKKKKEAQRRISTVTQKISETILGARIIKIFNREDVMEYKFRRDNQNYYREMLRVMRLREFTKLVIDAVTGIGVALAMWYGISLIFKGVITAGDLASIIVAIYLAFAPVKKIGHGYTVLQETRASIERIDTLLEEKHEESGNMKISAFRDSLQFNNVSFTYKGTDLPVLRNITFEIKHGETIAIVGQSGVGKTTVVDLISRFIIPDEGSILIDGTDINDIDLHSLRELIAIVSQDIILFNDTVRENILFGKTGVDDDSVRQAARLAHADEFIQELPEKYDTVLGERGLTLSGGQRQRIAIARAILKNPPLLILDEATSSLDSVSEALVQKALEKLMVGRTTIIIAHRLSTIKNADRIIVIDDGKILDIGTHDQLMSRNDMYTKLYNSFALS